MVSIMTGNIEAAVAFNGFEAALAIQPSSPNQWLASDFTEADRRIVYGTMAAAYQAGAESAMNHVNGHPDAKNLPIGAAAYDHRTGKLYQGIASDQATGDNEAHAEVVTIREAIEDVRDWRQVTLATTVEPCVICLEKCGVVGVGRVVYGARRSDIEAIALVNPRPSVHERIANAADDKAFKGLEVFRFPNVAVASACTELFTGITRNRTTGEVSFDAQSWKSTRYRDFLQEVKNTAREYADSNGEIMKRSEIDILRMAFVGILEQFYRPTRH